MTNTQVRLATKADVDQIHRMGLSDQAFEVSPEIKFYEKSELEQWASDTRENVLLVLVEGDVVFGFLFCKIISHHWGMLDNLYIIPQKRSPENSQLLMDALLAELKKRQQTYLTCLVRDDHESLLRLVRKFGFAPRHKYTWCELILDR